MARGPVAQEQQIQDAAFVKIMHGKSAEQRNAFMSMLSKDHESHRLTTDNYLNFWQKDGKDQENTEENREARKTKYVSLVNKYGFSFLSGVENLHDTTATMTSPPISTKKAGLSLSTSVVLQSATRFCRLWQGTNITSLI